MKLPDTLIGFWNVNAKYMDALPAEPSENGIVMISGYNPKMLETIMDTVKAASQVSYKDFIGIKKSERKEFGLCVQKEKISVFNLEELQVFLFNSKG